MWLCILYTSCWILGRWIAIRRLEKNSYAWTSGRRTKFRQIIGGNFGQDPPPQPKKRRIQNRSVRQTRQNQNVLPIRNAFTRFWEDTNKTESFWNTSSTTTMLPCLKSLPLVLYANHHFLLFFVALTSMLSIFLYFPSPPSSSSSY